MFFFTERALELWKSYDELFENLTRWTEEKEQQVEEHAQLQGSLEDKQSLLHKHKDLHEEVENRFIHARFVCLCVSRDRRRVIGVEEENSHAMRHRLKQTSRVCFADLRKGI